jgi:hypothetical protein
MWRRNLEVMEGVAVYIEPEGVGERNMRFASESDGEGMEETGEVHVSPVARGRWGRWEAGTAPGGDATPAREN